MSRAVDEKMAELSTRFGRRLGAKLDEVEAAWTALGGGAPDLQEFYRLIHSLAGSGATFGYSGVSASALAIEEIILPVLEPAPGARMSADQRRHVKELMAQLRLAAGTPGDKGDDPT